jgi:hypothetical protein
MASAPNRLVHPNGETLTLDPSRIVLGFTEPRQARPLRDELAKAGLVFEETPHGEKPRGPSGRVNESANRVWVRSQDGRPIDAAVLSKLPGDWTGAVYHSHRAPDQAGLLCVLPNALLLRLNRVDGADRRLSKYGLKEVPEKSKLLVGYQYFVVLKPREKGALEIRQELLEKEKDVVRDARFETIPMLVPTAMIPNDTHYALQWNMAQVRAGGLGQTGWDISTGAAGVVICVLDEGCDLTHPDLQFAGQGINLGTLSPPGSPTGNHGTACGGVAAASINNGGGVAGMAGACRILPAAFSTWSDVEVAMGINFATTNGARVISMSFGWNPWDPAIIDPAIQNAFNNNVVMCVATHNYNGAITYPATNPLVMAVGASDQVDDRKSPASPDGECWGSNFGPQISVVAPGVRVPTTDIQGNAAGYNDVGGAPMNWACVNYAASGDAAGDYIFIFDGTSAATPHVAGLAALLISYDNTLTNVAVRDVIEQTADKVGTTPYAVTPGAQRHVESAHGVWPHRRLAPSVSCPRSVEGPQDGGFDKIVYIEHKPRLVDQPIKEQRFKEKDHVDEVKGMVGYENPEFDHTIFEKILIRLDRLEQQLIQGRAFIRAEERPEVGAQVAREAPAKTTKAASRAKKRK